MNFRGLNQLAATGGIFTVLSLLPVLKAAIQIDSYSSPIHNRFEDSDDPDQFFLSSFDFSGIGQDSNGRWATLIGQNTIISANHFKPSGSISFYPDNDPATPAVTLGISADSQRIGNSDLWLARLDSYAPTSIQIYDYATENISEPLGPLPANFSFRGDVANLTGRSPANFPNSQDQAFGENEIDDFVIRNVDGLGDVGALEMNYDPGDTTYESYFQGGDSGGPLFLQQSGELLLLGINSYITETDTGDIVASYSSYLGNDSDEIDTIVADYAAIPETSRVALLSFSLLAFLTCRHRRALRQ